MLFNIYKDKNRLNSLRYNKLYSLLHYAKRNAAFYKNLYRDIDIDIKDISDISTIPIINKNLLKNELINTITSTNNIENLIYYGTSGSTGEPFQFYISKSEYFKRQLKILRFLYVNGWKPWWRGVNIWREKVEDSDSIFDKIINIRKTQISILDPLEKQASIIKKTRPQFIYGITSTLDILAKWMIENNNCIQDVKIIVGMGETITTDVSKRFQLAFGSKGCNFYGTNECGLVGWGCSNCGQLHFDDDGIIAEVVDENYNPIQQGKKGKILITVLDQKTTPIIRYDIGDYISLPKKANECRVQFNQFQSIDGRTEDRLILTNGRIISWQNIYATVIMLKNVERIQLYQREDGEVIIRYIPQKHQDPSNIENMISNQLEIKGDAKIRFEVCKHIPLEKSGKFQLLKKEIK